MIFGGSKKAYYYTINDNTNSVNASVNATGNCTVNASVADTADGIVHVDGYGNFGDVFYSLFRLTLVDEYDFDVRFFKFILIFKRMRVRKKNEREIENGRKKTERNNEGKKHRLMVVQHYF